MATNVNLSYPNFTLTPQAGTFGSINTSAATTIFRIKNTAGGLISDYTLSANIHPSSEVIGIEYCGPRNLTEVIDGVTFITVERLNSTQCIVKRWEIDVPFSLLNLKQQTLYYTTGNYYYDVNAMAVEHYHRTFDFGQPSGQNYLEISSTNNIESGSVLFLGPSSDTDNPKATEQVSVSFMVGNKVFLNSPTFYQYADGDKITFFNNIYLISRLGYAGDSRYGTIFKHNVYSGTRLEYTTGGDYKHITAARWSTQTGAISAVSGSQLLFIRPYDSYLKWKSMFLNNIEQNNKDYFTVYDIVFDEITVYKLMRKATTKNDVGVKTTESWSTYNYQQDTLLPYTHNVQIYMKKQYTIGLDTTTMYLLVRDQFGVSLRDVDVILTTDGNDIGASFDPLNGQAITDINGEASIGYITGGLYTGPTVIQVKANKSSEFTGSEFCWNSILIDGKAENDTGFGDGAIFQDKTNQDRLGVKLLNDPFTIDRLPRDGSTSELGAILPPIYISTYSLFETPSGNWITPTNYDDVEECWPWFAFTPSRTDGPRVMPEGGMGNYGCEWDCITWPPSPEEEGYFDPVPSPCPDTGAAPDSPSPRTNFLTQVLEFTQVGVHPKYYLSNTADPEDSLALGDGSKPLIVPQVTYFWQYYKNMNCAAANCKLEEGQPIPAKLFELDRENTLGLSQLNLSKHSHWVDGVYTSNLTTNVRLDQFVFVEDAVPTFWSSKNPRETDIWIRMRPFAFSLNGDTLRFFIREIWTVDDVYYDTGYYDVVERYGWPPNNDRITLTYFDAGGGTLGIEFTYDNPDIYHHTTLVYVHIEIYDTAAEPNYIYTDYWFEIIPDYKPPYLENESPDREEDQVAIDTDIYFEIKDDGEGIDISTLEVFINSRTLYNAGRLNNPNIVVEKVNLNHYKVTISPPYNLQYNKAYSLGVRVQDLSPNKNILRDSYRFYTRHSEVPWFTGFDPRLCKRGMPKFKDVSFIVLGAGEGVDEQTIRIQVHDKDVTDKSDITPVIYRIS